MRDPSLPGDPSIVVDRQRLTLIWGFVLLLAACVGVVLSEYSIRQPVYGSEKATSSDGVQDGASLAEES
jgi:hypothetical protein